MLRGGNYPHRGLKLTSDEAFDIIAAGLRGGNYPHRGLKRGNYRIITILPYLRGGNYPHRGLKLMIDEMRDGHGDNFAEETIPIGD